MTKTVHIRYVYWMIFQMSRAALIKHKDDNLGKMEKTPSWNR